MNKLLVVIPFNLPLDWSTDYANQTALELSKKGNIVLCYLWADKIYIKDTLLRGKIPHLVGRYAKNIYFVQPWHIIPLRRFKIVNIINEFINGIFLRAVADTLSYISGSSRKIFWIFDPTIFYIYKHFKGNYKLVYDCVDYFPGTFHTPREIRGAEAIEKELSITANLVTANSLVLQEHLKRYVENVLLVPQGFRMQSFKNIRGPAIRIKRGKRTLVGFAGGVDNRIDYKLLFNLAIRNKELDFALWGPKLEGNPISSYKETYYTKFIKLPNVITGSSSKKNIPKIINQFDIGIIPYDLSNVFNKFCFPMKLFEYFYLGKPVISSPIEELKKYSKYVKIGKNFSEWEQNIKLLTFKPFPQKYRKEEKKLASKNSWENKINLILSKLSFSL